MRARKEPTEAGGFIWSYICGVYWLMWLTSQPRSFRLKSLVIDFWPAFAWMDAGDVFGIAVVVLVLGIFVVGSIPSLIQGWRGSDYEPNATDPFGGPW